MSDLYQQARAASKATLARRDWPKDATRLSSRLSRDAKPLAAIGIDCRLQQDRRGDGGTRQDVEVEVESQGRGRNRKNRNEYLSIPRMAKFPKTSRAPRASEQQNSNEQGFGKCKFGKRNRPLSHENGYPSRSSLFYC